MYYSLDDNSIISKFSRIEARIQHVKRNLACFKHNAAPALLILIEHQLDEVLRIVEGTLETLDTNTQTPEACARDMLQDHLESALAKVRGATNA